MTDELVARLRGDVVGVVRRVARRGREFVALEEIGAGTGGVRLAESFSLVPGRRPDVGLVSRFLGGYLPEGAQRTAMADKRGIPPDDLFAFLREYGRSIAGALTFHDSQHESSTAEQYEALSPAVLRRELRRAVAEHDLGGRDDSRSMLAGFQPKLLVAKLDDGEGWLRPRGGGHSTHILKPRLSSRPSRLLDEYYSHQLAREVGLATFSSELHGSGEHRYLAIERFDRRVVEGRVELIHQEDAAQALGLDWTDDDVKFQSPARPRDRARPSAYRIAEIAATLRSRGSAETWLRQMVFRVLVGDNDGHAKNVGILHRADADELTDLYDAVPNLFQEGRIQWNMALAIDGAFDHRRVSVERLLAEVAGWAVLSPRVAEATIADVLAKFRDALNTVRPPRGVSPGMVPALERHVARLLAGSEIGD